MLRQLQGLVLILGTVAAAATTPIREQLYQDVQADHCIRLFTRSGSIGCSCACAARSAAATAPHDCARSCSAERRGARTAGVCRLPSYAAVRRLRARAAASGEHHVCPRRQLSRSVPRPLALIMDSRTLNATVLTDLHAAKVLSSVIVCDPPVSSHAARSAHPRPDMPRRGASHAQARLDFSPASPTLDTSRVYLPAVRCPRRALVGTAADRAPPLRVTTSSSAASPSPWTSRSSQTARS